jgi:hypothetical protein
MSNARTDVHAPAAAGFDPEAYACYGCFDNGEPFSARERHEAVKSLRDRGFKCGHGSSGQCGHCGAHIRYTALLAREDVKEFIFVGEDCLGNRFSGITAGQFQELRRRAALNRERAGKEERIERLQAEHACLKRLVEDGSHGSEFLSDVRSKFLANGRLSDAQVAAVGRAFEGIDRRAKWDAERRERAAALVAAGVRAPQGRVEVVGQIVSAKSQLNAVGEPCVKIVIRTDAGWSAWVTLPSALDDGSDVKGRRIKLSATLTPSDKDATFAFGKRPTKAAFLDAAATA